MMINVYEKFEVKGRTAIVTGAAQGLGKAMAEALLSAGANIVIADIHEQKALETLHEFQGYQADAIFLPTDVTSSEQIHATIEKTIERFHSVDILINNAGMNKAVPAEILSESDWRKIIDTDLTSVFLFSQAVGKIFIRQKKGKIINIASMSGRIVNRHRHIAAYCTAKGGVIMLTKALASEWAEYNINVNAIAPGYFYTPLNKVWIEKEDIFQRALNNTPLKRLGQPEEIGPLALFLASSASDYMTGEVITIDGGYTIW